MASVSGAQVIDALMRNGFEYPATGEASPEDIDRLLWSVACAWCEGKFDDAADNHYDARAGRYGVTPGCWGTWQFCNTNSEYQNVVGKGLDAQAGAFVRASNSGRVRGPWTASKGCWSGAGAKERAGQAMKEWILGGGTGGRGQLPGPGGGGGLDLVGAFRDSIERVLGVPIPEAALRVLEIVGGAIIMAVGVVMFLEVVSTPTSRQTAGVISSTARKATGLATRGQL